MKSLFFTTIIFATLIFMFSCGPSAKEKSEKMKQDSIAKIDSISKNFLGYWHDYHEYSNHCIKISKTGESFLIEKTKKGIFGGGREGIYTLTKEGNLRGSNFMNTTIAYDKSNNQLLVGDERWESGE